MPLVLIFFGTQWKRNFQKFICASTIKSKPTQIPLVWNIHNCPAFDFSRIIDFLIDFGCRCSLAAKTNRNYAKSFRFRFIFSNTFFIKIVFHKKFHFDRLRLIQWLLCWFRFLFPIKTINCQELCQKYVLKS